MGEQQLQDPSFYTRRYIISSCMSWNDINYLRDGTKTSNWKKATSTKIRISPDNWKSIEIKGEKVRSDLTDVKQDEANDDRKTQYLLLTFNKECIAITSRKEFLDIFYCALNYVLNRPLEGNDFLTKKNEEFKMMLESAKEFIFSSDVETVPPVPEEPPNYNFVNAAPKA